MKRQGWRWSDLPPARAAVREARELAKCSGVRLFIAGGAVRDLLSARPIRDVDLVLEAEIRGFARDLAQRLQASLRVHARFGTATLTLPDGSRLDVAAARKETYAAPGALPSVSMPASIEEDLARRDFTVNAMALEISPTRRLVDPFGGRLDLARGLLRVLHARSFVDDPTRAFRAVRYAHRLRFRIAPATRRAVGAAIRAGAFDRVSGDRIRRELVKIFAEPDPAGAVRRIQALGLDSAIEPAMARAPRAGARIRAAEERSRGRGDVGWLGYFLAWMGESRGADARRIASRLQLAGKERSTWLRWPETRRRLSVGLSRLAPSQIVRRTAGLSGDELVALAAFASAGDRRALDAARQRHPQVRLRVSGSHLLDAGIPTGAAIGKALARTRDARLDGKISAEQELAFAVDAARREAARR